MEDTGMSDRFYRVLDDSRFNRVLLPDRIQFEKVRFQGVKRGSKAQKSANFQYVFGSLLSVYTLCPLWLCPTVPPHSGTFVFFLLFRRAHRAQHALR
jgi:hypothetical protein